MKGETGLLCGLGPWRPSWLQKFNSSKGFLVVYGLLGTIQAMSYIYFVATLTTLEKRFKISSRTTGLMMSGNEISQVMLSLVLSYYGGQRNRPLWIAWGVAFSAASCYILAMPHLLYGPGDDALALTKEYTNTFNSSTASKDHASLCVRGGQADSHCNQPAGGEFSNIPALLVFLSQFVLGIGTTLYYALGQTYLDDNTKKSKTPLLLSLTMSLRTIGPAIGFILGYGCLRLYIAPTLTPTITNKDPRWLGAWWLGWLILGTAMLLFSFLIAMFPKKMPPSKSNKVGVITSVDIITLETVQKTEKSVEFKNGVSREKLVNEVEDAPPTLKEFPAALSRLLRNKLLMANILSAVFYILGGSAYITYITKYMEVQFHQSAAGASFIIGPTAILSMTSGFLVSGAVISKFKPRPTYLLGWNVIVGISFVIGELSFIFLSCEDSSMVGFRGENTLNLINECNSNCGCNSLKFSPVCLEQAELTFYTACHAGCQQADYSASPITFTNCSCIPDDVSTSVSNRREDLVLKTGACRTNCYYNFILFIAITMVMHSLGSSGKIGNVLVNYRAVDAVDKSFAQGLGLLMVSLFAFIPGPILYGAMIDSTCLVWDETCGRRGNCWLYDKYRLRFTLNVTSACLTMIGVLFDALVCYLGRDLKLYEDEEDSNKNSLSSTTNGKHDVLPSNEKTEKA